jgi:hypothetical protein
MMFSSSCACHDTDDGQTSSSPAANRRASSVLGAEKKVSAGPGLAEFERHLIIARTGEGRKRAKAHGVRVRPSA